MTDPTPATNHPFDLRVVRDAAEAGTLAADLLTNAAHTAVAARGRFTLAIPGGSVPTPVFTALAEREFPWDATRLLWVDERAVPPDHEHSNYGAFARDLLPSLPIPATQVLRMRGELGPDDGARDYTTVLGNALAGHPLDAALLGIGEDGHVASLFPGKDALEATDPVLPIHDSPKPPPERITLSLPILRAATTVVVVALGQGKKDAITQVLAATPLPTPLPARLATDRPGATWIIDDAAKPDTV